MKSLTCCRLTLCACLYAFWLFCRHGGVKTLVCFIIKGCKSISVLQLLLPPWTESLLFYVCCSVLVSELQQWREREERVPHCFSWEPLWLVCGQPTCGSGPLWVICFSLSMFDFYHRGLLDCVRNMTFSTVLLYNLNLNRTCCFHHGSFQLNGERIIYLYSLCTSLSASWWLQRCG